MKETSLVKVQNKYHLSSTWHAADEIRRAAGDSPVKWHKVIIRKQHIPESLLKKARLWSEKCRNQLNAFYTYNNSYRYNK